MTIVDQAVSESPADIIRALVRSQDRASLATKTRAAEGDTKNQAATPIEGEGAPYASLVLLACDLDASPLLLLSDLADHTKNIYADPVCSLMIDGTQGLADPLTGARATLQGRLEKCDTPNAMARYIRRHPSAGMYAGFADFSLYRMSVQRAHLVAGFGKIHWVSGGDVLPGIGEARALADQETDVVEHMNEDHADAVALYANVILGLPGVGWRLTGVDPEGADLRRDGEVARLPFDKPVADAESARVELVRLVKRARNGQKP